MKKFVFGLLPLVLGFSPAAAVVLFSDSFSYPDGSLITNSAGVWATHSGTTGQLQVLSGRAGLSSSSTEDVNAPLVGAPYLPAGGAVLYAAFTVSFSGLPTQPGSYFAHFKDSSTGFRARLWASTLNAAPNTLRVGIGNGVSATNTSGQWTHDNLQLGTNYRIVIRYLVGTGVSTLWLNPATENSVSVTASDPPTTITVTSFALRQATGIGIMTIDDLSVGTTFADVVSANPTPPLITAQPESQSVTVGSNVTFSVSAVGATPLRYQWHVDDSLIAGATNALLTLSNVTFAAAGDYFVTITNALGATNSELATLIVNPPPPPPVLGFTLLTYNVAGNGATNWSTNAPQVRAIGRQLQYLNPDIITFQEIPYDLSYEMTNFVTAFLPGYALARNSGTDGSIRSVIASRFPITRSRSWLNNLDLRGFGYSNANNNLDNFTRDLFEAQIEVPGFPQPLHVFTTHLKATSGTTYTDAAAKRAAEASAITNFLATNLLAQFPLRPYVLTGDLNDSSTNALAIQKLISPPTGLRLTNPIHPLTGSLNTFSIRASLNSRLDYLLPNTLLLANVANSQVFRTDLLPAPPPPLLAGDSAAASDHLAVWMAFNNPYDKPFQLLSTTRSNLTVTLTWQSVRGQPYDVVSSSNLTTWSVLASNLTATGAVYTFSTNLGDARRFFRVRRVP